ncbi:MAG TPA: hypothetical protein VGH38_08295 [Bryobacteraceae bacterium]
MKYLLLTLVVLAARLTAADPPMAEISNGVINAKLYLPDTTDGYYRATRFDWSGQVASVEYKGHKFFGQWFEKPNPKLHDSIMGPVEEFLTDGAGLGYAEAKPGENFVKIGVGAIKKPDEPRFRQFNTYEIADSGKWTIRKGKNFVEFTQAIPDTGGYKYLYKKTLRLTKGKPELVLEHSLKNTGTKTIDSTVYEHNFYMIDAMPTGPDTVVKFPFDVRATADLKGLAEIRGKELVYLKELQKGQTVQSNLVGFGDTAKDYDIRMENRKAGAGVRQTGDRPIERINYWSIRNTACPEAYVHIKIEPGKEFTWRIAYEFYTLNP